MSVVNTKIKIFRKFSDKYRSRLLPFHRAVKSRHYLIHRGNERVRLALGIILAHRHEIERPARQHSRNILQILRESIV
jgi:hypothetical protein